MTILEALQTTTGAIKTWVERFTSVAIANKADKSTTLAGYGITDACAKSELGPLALKSTLDKSDLSAGVQSSLDKANSALQSYTETDPTVHSWAKASSKPTYTKSEVGLGNVDNVKQYSASNPPPYPVTSVNGSTGAITINVLPNVTASDNGKVLMVVNGVWKAVELNMSVDSNGVAYI